MEHLLIIDDETDYLQGLARLLGRECPGVSITTCSSASQALCQIQQQRFDLALVDIRMPEMDGLKLFSVLKENDPDLTIIMMTAFGTIDSAVAAMKQGAWDFVTKPLEKTTLLKVVRQGLERNRLLRENLAMKERLDEEAVHGFIGQSPVLLTVLDQLHLAAASDYNVLIRGESGTGKELAGRAIHRMSGRKSEALITVNCPAIPEHLLESELFGHVRGAFTGADRDHCGLFVEANGGTICLDEIGDIPLAIQTKLLRVIESQEIKPLGSNRTVSLDVRIVALTNQNLEEKIKEKSFREDLFYRLNVLTIKTPPLRAMREDIPLLANHFLQLTAEELNRDPAVLTPEAVTALMALRWPGNVRELKNTIRRLHLFAIDHRITGHHVKGLTRDTDTPGDTGPGFFPMDLPYSNAKEYVLRDFSRAYFHKLLHKTSGNVSQAAEQAKMTRSALQKILKRFAIHGSDYRLNG